MRPGQRAIFSATMKPQTILRSLVCILIVLSLSSVGAQAQSKPGLALASDTGTAGGPAATPGVITTGTNEFGVWGGSSSDFPTLISGSRDARLPVILGLRYGRTLATIKSVAFEFTIDAVPVAVVSQPRVVLQPSGPPIRVGNERDRIYGGGVVPVGFRFIFRREARVKPFVGARSGPFYFTSRVPRPDAARFNFLSAGP